MQNTSNPNSLVDAYQAELQTRMQSTFASADYRSGFVDGIEAYEQQCDDEGRKLTQREVCEDISLNIDPRLQTKAKELEQFYGFQACSPLYDAGFMAGWLYAHLFTPETIAAPRDTQPLATVLPFRTQSNCEH